jgi:3-phosphoshikimate 1-carboxyvinyltransferase
MIEIDLPASKSIHNRLLILNHLYELNLNIGNPSNSEDSLLLAKLLNSSNETLHCQNAGTVFRFLTALCCLKDKTTILTGSSRMMERPIQDLVYALQSIGADIRYEKTDGFPPLFIKGGLKNGGSIAIYGGTSSQFISALMMIGPYLEKGLVIDIKGPTSSLPYITMTKNLMTRLGFEISFDNHRVVCNPWHKQLFIHTINVEADWSAVAFWFQIISYAPELKVELKNLTKNSLQGDAILAQWAGMLGIKLTESENGLLLEKSSIPVMNDTHWNLSNYPDLAPALVVLLASLKRKARFSGLESLKIKESDRTLALQIELKKCGVEFIKEDKDWILNGSYFDLKENTSFENYNDHRMAMSLGSLSLLKPIKMENKEAVNKSYPDFWSHLKLVGVEV